MKKVLCVLLMMVLLMSFVPLGGVNVSAAEVEYAIFPGQVLKVTQGAYGEYNSYSHNGQGGYYQNAFDLVGNSNYFAPFSGTITKIKTSYNAVVLQSDSKVYWANGDYDYMSVTFVHDNDISDLYVGMHINQGEIFYQPGVKDPGGYTTDTHLHICVNKGLTDSGISYFTGDTRPNEAFFLDALVSVQQTGNYNWNYVTHTHSYDTYVYYWGEHPHYKCYQCRCGDVKENVLETTFVSSCATCSQSTEEHTHSYDSYVYYWDAHPHYKCYQCSCGDVKENILETTFIASCTSCCETTVGHSYDNAGDTTCNICGAVREVKSGWVQESGKWAYYKNGEKVRSDWMKDSVGWCYLGKDGYMLTNDWVRDSVGWCYVGSDGYCVTNCWKQDSVGWCYLDSNGRMATNQWIKDSVGWCYVGADGYCVTSCWKQDSVGWCYLDSNGRMATNQWIKDSVGWCYVGSDGYCVTNAWKQDSVGWCYLDKNGRMVVSDWVQDDGKWYYLDGNGYMMYSTSRTIGGKTYHFNASGVCTNP